MSAIECVAVAGGGAVGCMCRYMVQQMPLLGADRSWPTLAVNVIGCLLIGFVATLIDGCGGMKGLRLLLVTGFLGGFTTYSTFTMDAASMVRAGEAVKAFGYVAVTLVAGFASFIAGRALAERLL